MKRLFGVCLTAALVMASVAGCGSDSATETTEPAAATESAEAANEAAGEGTSIWYKDKKYANRRVQL